MASWSTKQKVLFGLGVYLALTIALLLIFGNDGKNDEFKPQDEFKLDDWIPIHIAGNQLLDHPRRPLPRCSPAP